MAKLPFCTLCDHVLNKNHHNQQDIKPSLRAHFQLLQLSFTIIFLVLLVSIWFYKVDLQLFGSDSGVIILI